MAFRGRGRGRGRGGGSDYRVAKHEPFIDFPEDVTLPCLPKSLPTSLPIGESNPNERNEVIALIKSGEDLKNFWKRSCYYLEETAGEPRVKDAEIERYSDRFKIKVEEKREALASYLKLTTLHFPPELVQGAKMMRHDPKKLRWGQTDKNAGEKVSDLFEEIVKKTEEQKEKASKGKQGDEEEEGEAEQEEAEETDEDEDDYCQNEDFDDDEDDANFAEEPDEDIYE